MKPDRSREIFTFSVVDAEHELNWEGIFSDLKERRLNKVDLIIYDSHNGIQTAAVKMFTGSFWQICHVHFICAVLMKLPWTYHKEITETLKEPRIDSYRLQEFAVQLDEHGLSRAVDTIHRSSTV